MTRAYGVMALIGLSQAAAALTLGMLRGMHPAASLLVFGLSWVAYVEASERVR